MLPTTHGRLLIPLDRTIAAFDGLRRFSPPLVTCHVASTCIHRTWPPAVREGKDSLLVINHLLMTGCDLFHLRRFYEFVAAQDRTCSITVSRFSRIYNQNPEKRCRSQKIPPRIWEAVQWGRGRLGFESQGWPFFFVGARSYTTF
uniref:Uncharacterized protein n=1 Tax=Tetraselmis sp. GSL018 TaxID=582737 RepID=A0A061RXJ0_9CHLO